MSSCGGSGRSRTGSSAGDGVGTGKLGLLLSVSYPLLAVLSLLRWLLCWLRSRIMAAVRAGPRAADEPGGVKRRQQRDASRSPERGERVRSYHRRAFEFISAALRVDEDEQGISRVSLWVPHFLCTTLNSVRKSIILTSFCSTKMMVISAFCKLRKTHAVLCM